MTITTNRVDASSTADESTWCGCCSTTGVVPPTATRCPVCGVPLTGPAADGLRRAVWRRWTLTTDLRQVDVEIVRLRHTLRTATTSPARSVAASVAAPVTAPVAARAAGEPAARSGPAVVAPPAPRPARPRPSARAVLTWTGAVLLALGAIAFAAWAWILLGDLGRLGLLVTATVVVGVLARAARRRAPNTAEALSLVSLTMLLVDWTVAQPASVDAADWFVGGLALTATVALLAAARGGWRALPVSGVVLADAAALGTAWRIVDRALDGWAPAGSVIAVAALVVAPLLAVAMLAACDRVAGWHPARRTSHWAAGLVWFLAGIGTLVVWEAVAFATEESLGWLPPSPWRIAVLGLLTASLAAAPLLALRRPTWGPRTRGLLGAAATLAPLGALALTLALWVPGAGSASEAVVTAVVALTSLAAAGGALLRAASGDAPGRPAWWGATVAGGGVGALAGASAWLIAAATLDQTRPWSVAAEAWADAGTLALVAAGTVVLAGCAVRARRTQAGQLLVALAALALAVAATPLAMLAVWSSPDPWLLVTAATVGGVVIVLAGLLTGVRTLIPAALVAAAVAAVVAGWWWLLLVGQLPFSDVTTGWDAIAASAGVLAVAVPSAAGLLRPARGEIDRTAAVVAVAASTAALALPVAARVDAGWLMASATAGLAATAALLWRWSAARAGRGRGIGVAAAWTAAVAAGCFAVVPLALSLSRSVLPPWLTGSPAAGLPADLLVAVTTAWAVAAVVVAAAAVSRRPMVRPARYDDVARTVALGALATVACLPDPTTAMRATTIAVAAAWWVAVALARSSPGIRAGLATVSAGIGSLVAVEWAWDSRALTVGVLIGCAALAAVAAWRAVGTAVSAACVGVAAGAAVTTVGLWVDGTGGRFTTTGVAVSVAAAALLAARPWLPGARATVAASVAGAAAVLGAALSAGTPLSLALSLTAITGGLLASGVGRQADRWRLAALGLAVPAAWAWLAVSDVTVLEAWALPLGAALLVAGWWTLRPRLRGDHHPSWVVWGPGLAVLLLPTAALVALGPQPPFWRLAYLAVTATTALLLGAGRRSQAPAVLGLVGLVALAVPVVGPWIAATPLWVLLTLAGAVLVWVGFTWEHRIAGARHARDVFEHFT